TGLHCEIERLTIASGVNQPFSKAAWMRAAGFAEPGNPTKRLNEYVLAPSYPLDHDAWEARSRKLNASAYNFACLIEALFPFTEEDPERVYRRIFAGSSFAGSVIDPERYRRAAGQLQELVHAMDRMVAQGNGREGIGTLF